MAKQEIIRAHSSDIRAEFERWVAGEWSNGARLVILEGLMGSGKSRLTKAVIGQRLMTIELDKFLCRPVHPDTEYIAAIDIEAVTIALREALRPSPLVIAEGPMAWPVTARARAEIPAGAIRRVYLKRMSSRNPNDWEALEFAQHEVKGRGEYFLSIDRYHVSEQPWLLADLILERTGRDDD